MGLLDLLYVASMPVVKVLLISGIGATLSTNYVGVFTQETRKALNKIVFTIFSPALLFSSLVQAVTLQDLISWWSMPINIIFTFAIGTSLGWIIIKVTKTPKEFHGIIVSNCSAGNLGNLLIVLIPNMCEQNGSPFGDSKSCKVRAAGYASFSMALGMIFVWTYVYAIIRSSLQYQRYGLEGGLLDNEENSYSSSPSIPVNKIHSDEIFCERENNSYTKSIINNWHQKLRDGFADISPLLLGQLKSPPNLSVVAGLFVGAIPLLKNLFVGESAPLNVVESSISLLGNGAVPSIILVMGGNLLKGLKSSKLKHKVIPLVIFSKFIVMPLAGLFIVKGATSLGILPDDPLYRFVLMIQYCVPPALNIGTIAQLFNVAEEECSVLLFWSYVVASLSLTFWSTIFMLMLLNGL